LFRVFRKPSLLEYFEKFSNTQKLISSEGFEESKLDVGKSFDSELVMRLFKVRGNWRRNTFLTSRSYGREHALRELETLRSEIADIKQRETSSERFISGAVAAVAFSYLGGIFGPREIFVVSAVSLGFSIFGYWRFREYQRNNFEIDCYLRELEYAFERGGGWVDFFFSGRSTVNYFQSRGGFWLLLILVSYGTFIFSLADWIGQPTLFTYPFSDGTVLT
jgi:hypothetical protein